MERVVAFSTAGVSVSTRTLTGGAGLVTHRKVLARSLLFRSVAFDYFDLHIVGTFDEGELDLSAGR